MNHKGVSAVIGVILMVAITIAVAVCVYVYVAHFYNDGVEVTKIGNFLGCYKDDGDYIFVVENETGVFFLDVSGVWIEDVSYLENFIDKKTTFSFLRNGNAYIYLGAYLCPS